MKNLLTTKFIWVCILSMFIVGCASINPSMDTPEKQLAAAEISWKHTLTLVQKNVHRMTEGQKVDVRDALTDAQEGLQAARLAVALMEGEVDLSSNLATVNSGLSVVRTILEQLEQQEQIQ